MSTPSRKPHCAFLGDENISPNLTWRKTPGGSVQHSGTEVVIQLHPTLAADRAVVPDRVEGPAGRVVHLDLVEQIVDRQRQGGALVDAVDGAGVDQRGRRNQEGAVGAGGLAEALQEHGVGPVAAIPVQAHIELVAPVLVGGVGQVVKRRVAGELARLVFQRFRIRGLDDEGAIAGGAQRVLMSIPLVLSYAALIGLTRMSLISPGWFSAVSG